MRPAPSDSFNAQNDKEFPAQLKMFCFLLSSILAPHIYYYHYYIIMYYYIYYILLL
jgi:hypothetical protein